jgi:release factor glutamine methyltransferase
MNTSDNSSKTSHWLHNATQKLAQAGISTSRLDSLVLLEDSTGKNRSWLLAHPDFVIADPTQLDKQIIRRAGHEPLAYIRGKSEFYRREFLVNAHTLEPRPETEAMIELVKGLVKGREKSIIADIGTGSGCIAISVKLEIPEAKVIATDIDVKCLETARENSKKLKADVEFYEGNLLEPLSDINYQISITLANLPYVPDKYELNEAAKFEPKHAVFGGEDGLDLYRELFSQLSARGQKPKYILTESLPFQHELLAQIAKDSDYELQQTEDFIQVFSS